MWGLGGGRVGFLFFHSLGVRGVFRTKKMVARKPVTVDGSLPTNSYFLLVSGLCGKSFNSHNFVAKEPKTRFLKSPLQL